MNRILIRLSGSCKQALRRRGKAARSADYRQRCWIILRLSEGASSVDIEQQLLVARATVSRVAGRFQREKLAGLFDHRVCNGRSKVTPVVLARLEQLLDCYPSDFGWRRPTWTRELLARQLEEDTGVHLSTGHVGRLLRSIGARWKRPKPVVKCPWPRAQRKRRLAEIEHLVKNLPANEVAFYTDEMDVHLNPRIGPDWMHRGRQKLVVTPGQNRKAYVAGALHTRSGELRWVFGTRKNSDLFVAQIRDLLRRYRAYRRIHLIVDNYCIHDSRQTRAAVKMIGGKIVLHFLPPYCPDHNPIEHVWKQLHDNTTRNHRCPDLPALLTDVDDCLHALSPFPGSKASLRRAPRRRVAESAAAI